MCRPRPSLTALLLIATACHINNGAVAQPEKSVKEATISGKIVDASAAPVAGAQVTLYRLESLNARWGRFKVEHAAEAADGAGTFKFPGLGDGYFMLSVESPGYPRTFRSASIQSHASQQVDIVLKPPVSTVIRVEDQDGKPVAGARVREFTQRGANGECSLRQMWMRSLGISIPSSDEQGWLRLPPLASGDIIKATIEHPGFGAGPDGRPDGGPRRHGNGEDAARRHGHAARPGRSAGRAHPRSRRGPAAPAFRRPVDDHLLRGGI